MRDQTFLEAHNAQEMWHPMAHPAVSKENPPRIITRAQGNTITDSDGKTVLDAVAGLWNVNLGYSCEPIKAAIKAQLDILPFYTSIDNTTTPGLIELSYELAKWFEPDGLTRSFFTSGGSDSVETALRLARQYHKVAGQPERTKFIAFKRGYHGTHFGAASVNGNTGFRRNYEPMLPGVFHLIAPDAYRNPFNISNPAALAAVIAKSLEDEIAFQGADTIAALIIEPVFGAGGVLVPHESLLPLLRRICDAHGILLILDEVVTAFGRTGAWTGARLWDVKPDLMTIAKAVTSGYFPLGAVMISERVASVFEANEDTRGVIGHGYTSSGHPVGVAAALACLKETVQLNIAENARLRGQELLAGLLELQKQFSVIGDVRGQGLMLAIELVSDRESKAPLPTEIGKVFQAEVYKAGVMVRRAGGIVIISPPLVISSDEVTQILGAIEQGLKAAQLHI